MSFVYRALCTTLLLLLLNAVATANPITLTISQNAQPALSVTGNGFVGYGSTTNLKAVKAGNSKKAVFNVAILGLTQPTLSSPNLLSLATFDYKLTSNCSGNCSLALDLVATGFTQPYNTFLTNLGGYMLQGSSKAHYTLSAFLLPFSGSPILLASCNGVSNAAASCVNKTAFKYSGTYGLDLRLLLDANGGSGTFTDSSISGVVPETGTLALFGTGLLALAFAGRKQFSI